MFKSKKIKTANHIGNILKDARYKTGLSLKMVAKHININKKYLEALENDEWQKLPGEIYAKNFLKQYCQFLSHELGIDWKEIKIDWQKISCFKNKNYQDDFKKKTKNADFFNLPKFLKIFLLICIILAVIFYLIWQIKEILGPPEITIYYPLVDLTLTENFITISGKTNTEVELKINNENIFLDANHQFSQTLNLQPGLNLIKIEGKKKYSKTRIIERKIIVE